MTTLLCKCSIVWRHWSVNAVLVDDTVSLTFQRMSWYLMSIMTMLEVPAAMLISISRTPFVLERLEGDRKRFGAIIIDTLESPIRLVFFFWVIFNSNSNNIWKKAQQLQLAVQATRVKFYHLHIKLHVYS